MKDTELIRSKSSGIDAVGYSVITWSVVNVTANINDLRLIYLDTSRVSREELCLPSFDVVNCLFK